MRIAHSTTPRRISASTMKSVNITSAAFETRKEGHYVLKVCIVPANLFTPKNQTTARARKHALMKSVNLLTLEFGAPSRKIARTTTVQAATLRNAGSVIMEATAAIRSVNFCIQAHPSALLLQKFLVHWPNA